MTPVNMRPQWHLVVGAVIWMAMDSYVMPTHRSDVFGFACACVWVLTPSWRTFWQTELVSIAGKFLLPLLGITG